MILDPKRGNDLLAKLLKSKTLPIVPDPAPALDDLMQQMSKLPGLPCAPEIEPDEDLIDYDELAIEIWGHCPGPLDAQQQHDLLVEARGRGLL